MASRPTTTGNRQESLASMSAASGAAGGKGLPQTMQLPNVPKMTDERSRSKYVSEYDRYEQELRKHHLGPAESTTTAGLKDLPSSFNRRVPLLNEPTAAERDYEHTQRLIHARKQKEQRLYAVSGTTRSGARTNKAKTKSRATTPRAASTAGERQTTPPSADEAAASPPTAAADAVTAAAPQTLLQPTLPSRSGSAQSAPRGVRGIVSQSIAGETETKSGRERSANTSAVPTPSASPGLSQDTKGAAARVGQNASSTPAPLLGLDRSHGKGFRDHGYTKSAHAKAPMVTVSSPHADTTADNTTKSAAPRGGSATRSARGMAPTVPSPPPAMAPPRPAAAPVAKLRNAKALEAALEASVAAASARVSGRDGGALSAQPVVPSPRQQDGTRKRTVTDDCADLVRVLVMPPDSFAESVQLDTSQYDLDWVSGFRTRPPHLVTIHNFLATDNATGASNRRINSPRSALVCLRNGISPADLTRDESELADAPGALPTDAALRDAVVRFRKDRHAARRQQLMSILLDDYLALCTKVPQAELIAAVQHPPANDTTVELPASLLQRRERQRRIFETNKVRMARQLAMEQEQHERRLAAEARQAQAEEEASAALAAKSRAEAEARAQQQARLDAQKAKNLEMEAFYQHQLQEKLAKAEEKNQARLEAQQRLFEARQAERARRDEERRQRFERNAQLQAELAAEVEAKRLAKAAKLEEIQDEREARAAQERLELAVKQARAAEAREAARRRAEQEEEQARQLALQRQAEADLRLQAFHDRRQAEIARRTAEEQLKEQRRAQVYRDAQEKAREFQETTVQRQLAHDAHLSEVQQQRALELAIRREQAREEMHTKAFAVLQKQRMDEYGKLRTVADLIEKRKAADFVEAQREAIQDAVLREREVLNAEREKLRAQFGDVASA